MTGISTKASAKARAVGDDADEFLFDEPLSSLDARLRLEPRTLEGKFSDLCLLVASAEVAFPNRTAGRLAGRAPVVLRALPEHFEFPARPAARAFQGVAAAQGLVA